MNQFKSKLSVIICVYNEVNTLEELITKVTKVNLPYNFTKEIIIIDNFSTDGSSELLQKYLNKHNFKILLQNKNLGKGNSILEGIKLATGDYIVFQDADLEYDPQNYIKLLEFLFDNNLDAVFGSRSKRNKNYHIYKLNSLVVDIFTKIINIFYGGKYTDTATNHKLLKTNVLKNLNLVSKQFDLDFEIAIKLAKYKYKYGEIAIDFHPRTNKDGKKIRFIDGFICLKSIIKFYFYDK